MKQHKLEKYLNSRVHITLSDNTEYIGILRATDNENIYFVESGDQCRFSVSLVKTIKKV